MLALYVLGGVKPNRLNSHPVDSVILRWLKRTSVSRTQILLGDHQHLALVVVSEKCLIGEQYHSLRKTPKLSSKTNKTITQKRAQ